MSDQIKYSKLTEETVVATGYQGEVPKQITLPNHVKHSGKTYEVKAIGESAFSGASQLERVVTYNIESIGKKAFAGCEKLEHIDLSDSLVEIEEYAFAWCNIENIKLPETTERIGQYAFVGSNHLRKVICEAPTPPSISRTSFDKETLNKGVLLVFQADLANYQNAEGWKDFSSILSIEEEQKSKLRFESSNDDDEDDDEGDGNEYEEDKDLILTDDVIYRIGENNEVHIERINPEIEGTLHIAETIEKDGKTYRVTGIEKGALSECDKIKQVFIPGSIQDIEIGVFVNCDNLTDIHVDESNACFTDIDGVLADKYKSILICYPKNRKAKLYEVPGSVIGIAPACFIDCAKLEHVVMLDNIRHIGIQAFYNCKNLRSIGLPKGLSEINGGAFYQCPQLESIYALGEDTAELNDPFDNFTLKNATLYVAREHLQQYKANTEWAKFCKIKPLNEFTIKGTDCTFVVNGEDTATLTHVDENHKGELSVPESIVLDGKTYLVDRIGRNALENCKNITTVFLPTRLRSICYQAFFNCKSLKSIVLPNNLKVIENEAFCQCSSLTKVEIPEQVEALGDGIFFDATMLQEITVADGNQQFYSEDGVLYDRRGAIVAYPAAKKDKVLTIKESVDAININTFVDAANLTNFEASPNSQYYATDNGVLTTADQKKLITYPRGRKEKNYSISEGIKIIGQWAFRRSKLTHVKFTDSLIHLESGAFFECDQLKSVELPEGLQTIGDRCFLSCENLQSVKLPQSLQKIEMGAFGGCSNLEDINLPDQITSIEHGTFANCISLGYIELPKGLESIGNFAFVSCPNMRGIVFPEHLNSIGSKAFFGTFVELGMLNSILFNSKDMCIEMKGSIPPVISNDTFDEYTYSKVQLIVPEGAVETYRSTQGWVQFKNIVSATNKSTKDAKAAKDTDTFTLGEYTYRKTGENTVTLVKYKSEEFWAKEVVPAKISYKGTDYTITSIGKEAFEETTIKTLEIEAPIEEIEPFAFANCPYLELVQLPNTLKEIGMGCFGGCNELKYIQLPIGLKEIGMEAFAECRKLTAISIPNGVEKINFHTFYNCFNLLAVTLGDGVESIEEGAFAKCADLQSIAFGCNLEEIGKEAFDSCESLRMVVLPNKVRIIGERAFNKCVGLQNVKLPESLMIVEAEAFRKCSMLRRLAVDEACTKYKSIDNVLYNGDLTEVVCCAQEQEKTTIVLPKQVKTIGNGAFEDCKIEEIVLGEKVTTIGERSFANSHLKQIELPGKLKSIGANAFLGCKKLTAIALPEKITHLKEGLFRGCNKLESVSLPAQMKEIEPLAFKGCSSLKAINIQGENCVIRSKAFEDCKLLEQVDLSGIKAAEAASFYKCSPNMKLKVAKGSEVDEKKIRGNE